MKDGIENENGSVLSVITHHARRLNYASCPNYFLITWLVWITTQPFFLPICYLFLVFRGCHLQSVTLQDIKAMVTRSNVIIIRQVFMNSLCQSHWKAIVIRFPLNMKEREGILRWEL